MTEAEKMVEIVRSGESHTLTDFYDWLGEQGYRICSITEIENYEPRYAPIGGGPEQLFADYFGIDLEKLEQERREMLEKLRAS